MWGQYHPVPDICIQGGIHLVFQGKDLLCFVFGAESLFSDLIMFLQTIDSLSVLGLNLKLKLKLLSVGPLNNNSRLLLILLPVALWTKLGADAACPERLIIVVLLTSSLIVLDLFSRSPSTHQLQH